MLDAEPSIRSPGGDLRPVIGTDLLSTTCGRKSPEGSVMVTAAIVGNAAPGASRQTLYRQSKRVLTRLLTRRWHGPRWALEPALRWFLRARQRSYLSRLLGDRAFALAATLSFFLAPCFPVFRSRRT